MEPIQLTEQQKEESEKYEYRLCTEMDVGCIKKLSEVRLEDLKIGNSSLARFESMCDKFKYILCTPPDNNCFYRSFLFGMLLLKNNQSKKEKMQQTIRQCQKILVEKGYPSHTIIDFFEQGEEFIEQLYDPTVKTKELFNEIIQSYSANFLTTFLKLMVSGHLLNNEDLYLPFIDGFDTIISFCQKEIEPMGKHAGELELSILTTLLDVKVRIYSLVVSTAETRDYPDKDDKDPDFNLLYLPGHYELVLKGPLF
ncbi:hypothetical protein HZS_4124 [Henneguya salminicola]|nr:hypothetical protein HZS_4124 [Henneguya salminicola]